MSKFDLFLSHSWTNKPFVESFKTRVEAKGVRCWIDTEQMTAGAWLFDAIQDGIDDSKIFVAFVSESYIQSDNCNKEFALAVDWKKDILPIRLIDGRWPPKAKIAAGLAGKLYLDGIQPIDENTLDKILENMGMNKRAQKDDVIKKDAVEAVMKKAAEVEETAAHTIQNSPPKKLDPHTPQIKISSNNGKASQVLPKDAVELVKLLKLESVTKDASEIVRVLDALGNIAESDTGRQSCIAAGAPLALTKLAKEKAVTENGDTAENVALAFGYIAQSESGRQSCIDAGAPLALTNLAKEKTVKENRNAAGNVADAYRKITGKAM